MRERVIQLIVGFHEGTSPSRTLFDVSANLVTLKIPEKEWVGPVSVETSDVDAFALLVDARTGISTGMVQAWNYFADRQFPRVLIVQGMEFAESDFDDMVLIANRVLEELATPYLVLHDDLGQPTGLIRLENNMVTDYSGSEVVEYPADEELRELVFEFRNEQSELAEEVSAGAFLQGTRAVALPIGETKPIGLREINLVLNSLATP